MTVNQINTNNTLKMCDLLPQKRDYIFELCTTVDGRYFILRDEVFDVQEQKTIGNIWSSIDIFKNIFQNVIISEPTDEFIQIKESIVTLPILESKKNLYELRDVLLEWNFFDDTWLGKEMSDSAKSISDSFKSGLEGLKKFGITISKGEWSQILTLLAKGIKWVLRKLKDAMYSNLGMIVDAILVASGIGKTIQWIPWALITALDIYQIANNDWPQEESNNPTWMKFMTLGFDILGLVTAGALAKSAKVSLSPLKNMKPTQIMSYMEKNPKVKSLIKKMIDSIDRVPKFLSSAQSKISKKFPQGAEFINTALGYLKNISTRFTESLNKLIGVRATKGVKAGASTSGITYGIEKYTQQKTGLTPIQIRNIETLQSLKSKYNGKDPFD